jgi:ribosome recycling factor
MSKAFEEARVAVRNVNQQIATGDGNPLWTERVIRAQEDALQKLLEAVEELETRAPAQKASLAS